MLSLLGLKRKKTQEETASMAPPQKARLVPITSSCTIKGGVISPIDPKRERAYSTTEIHRALNNVKKMLHAVANNLPDEWSKFATEASNAWNGNILHFMIFLRDYEANHTFNESPIFPDIEILEIFHTPEEMSAIKDWNWLMGELVDKHITLEGPEFVAGP